MKNVFLLPTDKPIKTVGNLVKDQYGDIHIFTKNDSKEYGKTTTKLNIFITSDEEIKEGNWCLHKLDTKPIKYNKNLFCNGTFGYKKIILTTDEDLIKDGVQAIPNEFLEWFIKNPGCDSIQTEKDIIGCKNGLEFKPLLGYKTIIPKEDTCICEIGHPYNNACCNVHGNIQNEEHKYDYGWCKGNVILPEEDKCVPGCKHFYGGEIKHHKDCFYYNDSFSKMYDDLKVQQERSYSAEDMKIMFEAGYEKGVRNLPKEINLSEIPTKEWFNQLKKKQ
jgi:hypothetical protein